VTLASHVVVVSPLGVISGWNPQRLYARHRLPSGEDTVRASWRHEEPSRNDLARFFDGEGVSNKTA
jgi:hypothetical protein